MTNRHVQVVLCSVLAVLWLGGRSSVASTVNFEGLTDNTSVNGQAGWTVEDEFGNAKAAPAFDEEVVDDGTGNQVLRISNGVASGSLSDQVYSHTTAPAGETGSALYNDRGPDHTMPLSPPNPGDPVTSNLFHAKFDFKSATGAAQSGLRLDISPSAKQSTLRNSFLRLADDGSDGLDVFFYETGESGDGQGFGTTSNFPEVASNLSYTDWHTAEIFIEFVDGANGTHPTATGNDVVNVLINGSLVYTGTSWESFYLNDLFGITNHRQAVDSLVFRSSTAGATLGNGFFFDNVTIDNAAFSTTPAIPEPTSLVLLALSGAALLRRPRMRA